MTLKYSCSDGRIFKVENKYAKLFQELMGIVYEKYKKINLYVHPENDSESMGSTYEERQDEVAIQLPRCIRTNTDIFIMAHEVGHILLGHISVDKYPDPLTAAQKEIEANNWALAKFKEWGLRTNKTIRAVAELLGQRLEEARRRAA